MRIFMVKTLHDKPDARALQMSACAAMQQGVELLRGRVQCVGEGRESSPFEGIALEDPLPRQMGRRRSHEGGGGRGSPLRQRATPFSPPKSTQPGI